jgi:hypothetical protein
MAQNSPTCCRPRSLSAAPLPPLPYLVRVQAQGDLSVPVKGLPALRHFIVSVHRAFNTLGDISCVGGSFETMTPFHILDTGSLICSDGVT